VKNEEANLGRCLASLAGAVDDIVVVDTGSTDRTVEIAREHGARVFLFKWCDDFSAARNESLRHARGSCILWVDADDELIERQPGALRELCQILPQSSWGYWVDVHCPTDPWGEAEAVLDQPRLFRNGLGVQFHGRLHEQAAPPLERQGQGLTFQDRVAVKHWGYIDDGHKPGQRSERNHRLLAQMIEEDPEESFNYYHLGLQYAGERDYAPAVAAFERSLELWSRRPGPHSGHMASLYATAAMCALELEAYDRVLEIEASAPLEFVSADLVHHAGIAWWRLGNSSEAAAHFHRVIHDPSLIHGNAHDRSTSTWRPLLMLAGIRTEMGELAGAYEAARQALDFAPTRPEILMLLGHICKQQGRLQDATDWARRLLAGDRDDGFKPQARRLLLNVANELDNAALAIEALSGEVENLSEPGALYLQARAHAMLGDRQREYELLDEGCRRFPADPDLRLGLAEALDTAGYAQQAIAILGAGVDYPPVPAVLYQRLAVLLARQGQLEDAATALQLAGLATSPPEAIAAPA
ncbi:MAG TPA: glycosyltransferase, partial [Chloroflexota bacterium]